MPAQQADDLPDYYRCVVHDVMQMCSPQQGVWVDLGCGEGPLGFALAERTDGVLVLLDPDVEALQRALATAAERGLQGRMVPVVGRAESLPLARGCADLVVSRGSIYFWDDPPAGVREVHRALRPGGKAMLGGGLGKTYPLWARREFIRRRRQSVRKKGPEAVRAFEEVRKPETFRRWARQAGLERVQVVGEGALPEDDPDTGLGMWLIFEKDKERQQT